MWAYCKSTANYTKKNPHLKLVNFMHVNYLLLGVESSSSQYLAYSLHTCINNVCKLICCLQNIKCLKADEYSTVIKFIILMISKCFSTFQLSILTSNVL